LTVAYAKPAYYAYQNLTSVLDHQMELLPVVNIQVRSDSSLSVHAFRHKLSKLPMVFVHRNGSIPSDENIMSGSDFRFHGLSFEQPVLVDMLTGIVYKLPENAFRKGPDASVFENIPVYDSPLMIVDRSLIFLRE
jgi:hypothetical protein